MELGFGTLTHPWAGPLGKSVLYNSQGEGRRARPDSKVSWGPVAQFDADIFVPWLGYR